MIALINEQSHCHGNHQYPIIRIISLMALSVLCWPVFCAVAVDTRRMSFTIAILIFIFSSTWIGQQPRWRRVDVGYRETPPNDKCTTNTNCDFTTNHKMPVLFLPLNILVPAIVTFDNSNKLFGPSSGTLVTIRPFNDVVFIDEFWLSLYLQKVIFVDIPVFAMPAIVIAFFTPCVVLYCRHTMKKCLDIIKFVE